MQRTSRAVGHDLREDSREEEELRDLEAMSLYQDRAQLSFLAPQSSKLCSFPLFRTCNSLVHLSFQSSVRMRSEEQTKSLAEHYWEH